MLLISFESILLIFSLGSISFAVAFMELMHVCIDACMHYTAIALLLHCYCVVVTSMTLKEVVVMDTFYSSVCQNLYFFN